MPSKWSPPLAPLTDLCARMSFDVSMLKLIAKAQSWRQSSIMAPKLNHGAKAQLHPAQVLLVTSLGAAAGQSELHEGAITHMALVENGSQLISISADGIMMLSSVSVLVKGIPVGHQPSLDLPPVHLMRQSDLVALDDRITELKNQVGLLHGSHANLTFQCDAILPCRPAQRTTLLALRFVDCCTVPLLLGGVLVWPLSSGASLASFLSGSAQMLQLGTSRTLVPWTRYSGGSPTRHRSIVRLQG